MSRHQEIRESLRGSSRVRRDKMLTLVCYPFSDADSPSQHIKRVRRAIRETGLNAFCLEDTVPKFDPSDDAIQIGTAVNAVVVVPTEVENPGRDLRVAGILQAMKDVPKKHRVFIYHRENVRSSTLKTLSVEFDGRFRTYDDAQGLASDFVTQALDVMTKEQRKNSLKWPPESEESE